MIDFSSPLETADLRLAALHNEIVYLEDKCNKAMEEVSAELKQRLYFLQWKRESLTIMYGFTKKKT